MEVGLKRRCERCLMLLLYIVAVQDANHHGVFTRADDLDICDRSSSDSEISVHVGHELSLSCLTDVESPQSRLTWYKNNVAIGGSQRTAITENRVPCTLGSEGNGGNCDSLLLSISDITMDDEGLYDCRGTGRENGTILVRVREIEGETSGTTLAMVGTATMAPPLTRPTCSSNITLDDVLLPSDAIALTCMTDGYSFSAGSLDWIGMEGTQMKNDESYSTSLVLNVETALSSHLECILSCGGDQQNCKQNLSCSIPFVSVSPANQEAEVGGNVSFTCEVMLKNYTVAWFVPGSPGEPSFDADQLMFENQNDGRTSTITISNLRPDQSGILFCTVQRNGGGIIPPLVVSFGVSSTLSASPGTENSGRTDFGQSMGSTTPHPKSTGCVFLRRHDLSIPSSSPLSITLIVVIAVCGSVTLITLVAIIIVCCRRDKEETITDINPVMAFGDLTDDNPVNMDLHFNVYSQHEIYDEGAMSSDVLRLDSTKRIPSVIHGRSNGHPSHVDRTSSFIPISEDQIDRDERKKRDDDDEPGRKLSYFVENDVYVTYDSNA